MGKTVKQALLDAIHYSIPLGYVENKLVERQLREDIEYTYEVSQSKAWKGALADCLYSLCLHAVNFSEADKSVNVPTEDDKQRILKRVKKLYDEIDEEVDDDTPRVYIHEW